MVHKRLDKGYTLESLTKELHSDIATLRLKEEVWSRLRTIWNLFWKGPLFLQDKAYYTTYIGLLKIFEDAEAVKNTYLQPFGNKRTAIEKFYVQMPEDLKTIVLELCVYLELKLVSPETHRKASISSSTKYRTM